MSKEHPLRLSFLVHDVARLRQTQYDRLMKPLGMTRSQYWVLSNLTRSDENGVVQTELADLMNVGKNTLGGLLDRLEARNLIRRGADPNDRRAKRVFLTENGRLVVEKMRVVAEQFNEELLAGASQKDVDTTERVLAEMKSKLLVLNDGVENSA